MSIDDLDEFEEKLEIAEKEPELAKFCLEVVRPFLVRVDKFVDKVRDLVDAGEHIVSEIPYQRERLIYPMRLELPELVHDALQEIQMAANELENHLIVDD